MTTVRIEGAALERFLVGMVDVEHAEGAITPLRLPRRAHAQFPNVSLARMVRCPVGVRLRVSTAASRIRVDARIAHHVPDAEADVEVVARRTSPWLATTGSGRARRVVARGDIAQVDLWVEADDGSLSLVRGGRQAVDLVLDDEAPSGGRVVEIWLPHNAQVELRGIEADAPLHPAPASGAPRWIHYGSSISQCNEAVDPLSGWPALAAHALGVDLHSFAFAGNAMLDSFVARAISDAAAEVITLKVGINIVNASALTARTLGPALHGFLDRIREGHPDTPIVVISAIICPMHEHTPGPTVWSPEGTLTGTVSVPPREGELTLEETRRIIGEVVRARAVVDAELHLLDGRELLGIEDATHLYDGLHPDQGGFDIMARRFVEAVGARPALAGAFASRRQSA
ncbi:GDSL-type esterase/lipase family protein [Microbacterium saperdae]